MRGELEPPLRGVAARGNLRNVQHAMSLSAYKFVLGLLGTILVEACLYGFHKIPFTCSYLPGKANVYYLFFAYTMLSVTFLDRAAVLERNALQSPGQFTIVLVALTISIILVRWRTLGA